MITEIVVVAVLVILIASAVYLVAIRGRSKLAAPKSPTLAQPQVEVSGKSAQGAEEVAPEVTLPGDMRKGVGRTRVAFSRMFGRILGGDSHDQLLWDELEETLLLSDLGLDLTSKVIEGAKKQLAASDFSDGVTMANAVRSELRSLFVDRDRDLEYSEESPTVWLVVGVNGVGKTTSIGKLSAMVSADGKRVILAAGDTFRAAAADQLQMWAERTGADIVRSIPGADPSSVVYDSIQKAAARGYDVVIADTAGRLHTKSNLMDELHKLRRTAEKEPGHLTEVLLVLDATTGQNGLVQAREFAKAAGITGVILTKLDGSAKGGIALAAEAELGVPIKMVGVGEKVGDLILFSPDEFLDALLEAGNDA